MKHSSHILTYIARICEHIWHIFTSCTCMSHICVIYDCCVWGPSFPPQKKGGGHSGPPLWGPCLLWPNGWMDQDATWYAGRPRPRHIHCVRWGPSWELPRYRKGHSSPHFSAHVYCKQTVAHLSNCWSLVL